MIWRLRLHKIRRLSESFLRVAGKVGILGAGLVAVGMSLANYLGASEIRTIGWPLLLLGGLLFLGGLGFALAGEATTVRAYAEGDTEEIPSIGKLFSGLAASAGGMAALVIAIINIVG